MSCYSHGLLISVKAGSACCVKTDIKVCLDGQQVVHHRTDVAIPHSTNTVIENVINVKSHQQDVAHLKSVKSKIVLLIYLFTYFFGGAFKY